jgi:thymidine phosphorylase
VLRIRNLQIDTHSERVFFIHEAAVRDGGLGFKPLDRVEVMGAEAVGRKVTGILNFCRDDLLAKDEIGLSEVAFADLGLPEGSQVEATLAPAPESVDRVRHKLEGAALARADFDAIIGDITAHRYSKVELSMFVLACGMRRLSTAEVVDLTRALIASGAQLEFGPGPIADKHCIGGIPGNRTTMVVVPILAALGVTVPKTSSRAITSPAGTADTMAMLADVALEPGRVRDVVARVGGCIAWGGALGLAPADDIMITVERPMGIDTEAQMVASILAKKKTAGATHALIDLPLGETAKVRTRAHANRLAELFRAVASALELSLEIVITEARGPIGRGIGPRLEALDVLSVLRGEPDAPVSLREKSLFLAGQLLEMVSAVAPADGYRRARETLDSGAALRKLEEIVAAQGARELPAAAPQRRIIEAPRDGRIRSIDCVALAKVAKLAGAPAHASAGVWCLRGVGEVVSRGEPLFEIHAQTPAQLGFARDFALRNAQSFSFGY